MCQQTGRCGCSPRLALLLRELPFSLRERMGDVGGRVPEPVADKDGRARVAHLPGWRCIHY